MAEGVNRGVRGAFQNGGNLYSLRHRRKIDNPTRPSADSYDNDLGCCVPFVEVLHQKETKKSNTGLSYQDVRGCGGSPIDDQRHIFNTNKEDHKKCTQKKKKKSQKEEKNTEKEVCEPTYKNSTYEGQEKKRK
ncbi:unnamed protein product [Rhizophagus irregularis]|nr:unnamed protein product [Rhizophagus irregularis]